jgi:iron complex outermembrane receptor protein
MARISLKSWLAWALGLLPISTAMTTFAREAATRPAAPAENNAPHHVTVADPTTQPATRPSSGGARAGAPRSDNNTGDFADLSLEDLMNVQVTSVSKQAEKISTAPAAVTVITQNDMQRSGLNSIPEFLRLVPGMDVGRLNANQWAISARGFNGQFADNLLVLMDGRSVYTPVHGGVVWNSIDYPLADLDRVEVIRGPGATLWGSNAVNGVVNIITKPADQTQGLLLESRIGTDQSDGDVRYGGKIDDTTWFRGYAKYGYTGSFPLPSGDLDHDQWQTMQTGFRIDRYLTPIDTATLQGDFNQQQAKERFLGVLGGESDGNADTLGGNVIARWTHCPSVREETSLQFYYTGQNNKTSPAGYREADFDLEFQNRFPLGDRQDITWGVGGRNSQVAFLALPQSSFAPSHFDEYIVNGFIQDQIAIVPDRLSASIGTKLEYNNLTNLQVEPGTRLAWTPDKQNTVWAAISRPIRIPSLSESVQSNYGPLELIPNHPHSEQVLAYELGYKTQPCKSVTVDVSCFYNTYKGLIDIVPSRASPLFQYWTNALAAQSYGAELATDWQVSPQWKLGGSYTFLNVRAQNEGGGANLPASGAAQEAGTSPENQFQIHSYFDITRNLQFNTSAYYVQGLPRFSEGPRQQNVPEYFRLDMGLTWRFRENMSVTVGGQNILQKRHAESGNIGANLVPSEVPRSAYVQFQMEF